MKVTVVLLGRAGELAGRALVDIELPEGSTLYDLMKKLGEEINPSLFKRFLEGHFIFVVHVNNIPTIDATTKLKEGDRVTLLTPEMGG